VVDVVVVVVVVLLDGLGGLAVGIEGVWKIPGGSLKPPPVTGKVLFAPGAVIRTLTSVFGLVVPSLTITYKKNCLPA